MSSDEPTPQPPRAAFLPGVIGFYLGIGTASLGGGVTATGFFLLEGSGTRTSVIVVGVVMMVAGFLGAVRFLKAARQKWQ